jgi:hypothetical protein
LRVSHDLTKPQPFQLATEARGRAHSEAFRAKLDLMQASTLLPGEEHIVLAYRRDLKLLVWETVRTSPWHAKM